MDLMDFDAAGLGVLVGVDGSAADGTVVDLAVQEARLRGLPLTVCHVRPRPPPGSATDVCADPVADAVLARLAGDTGDTGGVTVRPLVEVGHPAEVLATLAADAEMTVVGSGGRGGASGPSPGSVSLRLATRAPGPVLVARSNPSPPTFPGPFDGHVVVGVDGSSASSAALEFGFAEADRRARPLAAVHLRGGWTDSHADDRTPRPPADRCEAGRELLDAAVQPWSVRYPKVTVKRAVPHGSPVSGLLRAAVGAVLLAVGRTGRAAVSGTLSGSVSQAVLHRARCPVAVLPANPDGPLAGRGLDE